MSEPLPPDRKWEPPLPPDGIEPDPEFGEGDTFEEPSPEDFEDAFADEAEDIRKRDAPPAKPPRFITPMQPVHFLIMAFIGVVLYQCVSSGLTDMRTARIRPNASRAKSDMRALATGIESYFLEAKAYPNMRPLADAAALLNVVSRDRVMEKLKQGGREGVSALETSGTSLVSTTGTVYMQQALYVDPFAPDIGIPFVYYADAGGWVLVSAGPDNDYDMVPSNDYVSSETQPSARLLNLAYDPTNGTVSGGDIWRVKQ